MTGPTDFYDDRNQQQLYALDHLCPLPEFVKKAEVDDPAQLPSDAFGDIRHRKFPCHTKAATWLANAYFQQGRSAYSKKEAELVQGRINKFASHWAISGLVGQFNHNWSKIASHDSQELSDTQYGLVATTDDGQKIRRFPMPNCMSVKWAGERLYADRYKYPYLMRKTAARNILREAIKYDDMAKRGEKIAGVLPGMTNFEPQTLEYLERAAGFGATHPMRAAEKVAQRVVVLKGRYEDHAEKMAELAVALREMPSINGEQLMKLANVIDAVDRETGLCDHYHEGLEMPEEIMFPILEKEAAAILDERIVLSNGSIYPVGLLLELPLEKIAAVLGNDIMDSIVGDDAISIDPVKMAAILPTLPRPDAALLDRLILEGQKEPWQKTARAGNMAKSMFDKDEMLAMAKKSGLKANTEDFQLTMRA